MKYLLGVFVLVVLVGLVGCGDRSAYLGDDIDTECLDGVSYYTVKSNYGNIGYGFMAPKYNRDGTISLCGGAND